MKTDGVLMLATKIPTGLKLIEHDNPSSPDVVNIFEGDYLMRRSDGSIKPHFSAYAELQKLGVRD